MSTFNVIGIDPSMTGTGIAYADGSTSTVRHKITGDQRLANIAAAVAAALDSDTALAVLEDLPTHAHGAGITGMVQGVVRLTLLEHHTPYVTVTPATLKKYATGRGNATKADMRVELIRRGDLDLRDDDQVDAWWLRALGHHLLGDPVINLPQTHLAALVKVAPIEPRVA